MGASRPSARASCSLWRAVQTYTTSTDLVTVEKTGEHLSIPYLANRVHHLSTTGQENLSSFCSSLCRRLNNLAKHGAARHNPSTLSGVQSSRNISSQVLAKMAHGEDIEVKEEEEVGLKDELLGGPLLREGEPGVPLLEKVSRPKDADFEALFSKLENCTRPGSDAVVHIKRYISKGHEFTKDDAILLMTRLRRYSRYKPASEISDWMLESKVFPWTTFDQALRLTLKGKLGNSSEVEEIFNNSTPEMQTEIAYNAVIRHFCERGMVKKSHEWMEKLIKRGGITHAFAFNRVLQLYKDRGMGNRVAEVLDNMHTANISKDSYTYNILMSMKGREKDVEGLEKVFEECKSDPNVELDAPTYATLAGGYITAGLTEKAVTALEAGELLLVHKRPGNVDEVMATLWGKLGNQEKVLTLWETMNSKQTVAARTYVVMIETFGKLGMVEQAEKIYEEMIQKKGPVRPRQFSSLMSVYVNNKLIDKVEGLVAGIGSLGLKLNATINHHVVQAYLKLDKLDRALAYVSKVKGDGDPQLWFTTMVGLLVAVGQSGDVAEAEEIFQMLKKSYNQTNLTIYHNLLKAYVKAGVPVEGFLDRMAADKIVPNKDTLVLLDLCSTNDTPVKETPVSVDAT